MEGHGLCMVLHEVVTPHKQFQGVVSTERFAYDRLVAVESGNGLKELSTKSRAPNLRDAFGKTSAETCMKYLMQFVQGKIYFLDLTN